MPKDIYRSNVQANAPRWPARAPRARDMRGNEQAEAGLVESITRLGSAVAMESLKKKAVDDAYKVQADKAFNDFRAEIAGPRAQFKVTELSGAADKYPGYQETVSTAAQTYRESLAPEAQKLFDQKYSSFSVTLADEAQSHLATEFVKTKRFNADQDVRLSVQEAMMSPYDKQADLRVASALYNQAVMEGGTAGITENETWQRAVDQKMAQKYSPYLKQKISMLADRIGDGQFAESYYAENKQFMTPEDRQAVETKVRDAALRDQGQALASQIFQANPEAPAKGYAKLMQITDPELQRSAQKEFARMVQIDKQNLAVNRASTWNGFHDALDQVEPGASNMQEQVNAVKTYISGISDKIDNLGGPTTVKKQMLEVLDNKLKPGKKVSDPAYLAQLNRMTSDMETFSVMDIDHSRLAPADSKNFISLQQSMQWGDAKTIGAIRSANADYYGVIRDVLVEKGFFPDAQAANTDKSAEAMIDAISSEFVNHLSSMRQAYGQGAEFMDSNTIKNINQNKQVLKERLGTFLDQLKSENPDLTSNSQTWVQWLFGVKPSVEKRTTKLRTREFTPVPIPENNRPSTFAPPAQREQREDNNRKANKILETLMKRRERQNNQSGK